MRDGIPSVTALAVAAARGLGALPSEQGWRVTDPFAHHLLPFGATIARLGAAAERSAATRRWIAHATLGLADHVSLRTAAIDAALLEAVAAGAEQLVIVGAGLDARAWRLHALGALDVFEVDHPATQRFKRRQARGLEPRCRDHRYVSVDFERDDLGQALEDAGHDPGRPSFWIWEGVTMYLHPEATRATLHILRARSSPGSALALTYATGDMISALPAALHPLIRQVFGVIGEPLRGLTTPDGLSELTDAEGWRERSDAGPRGWAEAHRPGQPPGPLVIAERLRVCEIPPE